jgi:hypothetical protein
MIHCGMTTGGATRGRADDRVRRVVGALVVGALVTACAGRPESATTWRSPSTDSRVSSPLHSLARRPVLDELGIPEWHRFAPKLFFRMGFETADEAAPSYVTPQSEATRHERWSKVVHSGSWAETGWLTGAPPSTPEVDGPNHRGYPTIQFPRMGIGACVTPCVVDLWVWLDARFTSGEWFSLATFALEPSDRWARVVTVNVGSGGTLSVFHVPVQGRGVRAFQTDDPFPMRRWVRLTTYLDLGAKGGVAAVWQDGKLASVARVRGGDGMLAQAHFGLYAPPQLVTGRVVNDDISVWRVERQGRRS